MKRLQNNSGNQYPYVYLDKLMIEMGFRWKKGQAIDIDYDVLNKRIIITEFNNERKL
jgi:hypothetical protein